MSNKKVKNISEQPQTVQGYGVVERGEVIEVPEEFSNPNFEDETGKRMIGLDPKTEPKSNNKSKKRK